MAGVDEVDQIVEAWQRERPDLDVTPLHVMSRLSRINALLDDRRAQAFVEHGLQAHEFDVLAALRRAGEPFELTAGELCQQTHVTSGTMTSRIDRLSQRRLVTRRPDPLDGRLVQVRLTDAGRERVDAAFAALVESEQQLLDRITGAKQARLAGMLRELLAAAAPD